MLSCRCFPWARLPWAVFPSQCTILSAPVPMFFPPTIISLQIQMPPIFVEHGRFVKDQVKVRGRQQDEL